MTVYAGATVDVSTGTVWKGRRLDAGDVNAVNYRVVGPLDRSTGAGEEVQAPQPLAWDADRQRFAADWTTPDIPGEYGVEVIYAGADGSTIIGAAFIIVEPRIGTAP
jgi:hypothetical protein